MADPEARRDWPEASQRRAVCGSLFEQSVTMSRSIICQAISTADKNRLPDSAFLLVLPGGSKDEGGRTTPRSLRMFPVRRMDGEPDLPRIRNALSRIPQSTRISASQKERLAATARRLLERARRETRVAASHGNIVLFTGAGPDDWALQGQQTVVNGVPTQRYKKEIMRRGDFTKQSSGQRIYVPEILLSHWANTFKRYVADGNKVPVPLGHDFTGDPRRNRGWVLDMNVEGDSLVATIELVGEAAIEEAKKSDVSIFSPPEWTDSEGHRYDRPIRHVALTTDPVINKLGPFVPIAASNGVAEGKADVYGYETDGETTMDLQEMRKRLGLTEEIDEENAVELICAHVDAIKADKGGDADLRKRAEKAEAALAEAKKAAPQALVLSDTERFAMTELVGAKIDGLVTKAAITPAVAKLLGKEIEDGGDLVLSASGGRPLAVRFLEALAGNDPVELGERTKAQTIVAARQTPEGDGDGDNFDQETHDRMVKMAGGTPAA